MKKTIFSILSVIITMIATAQGNRVNSIETLNPGPDNPTNNTPAIGSGVNAVHSRAVRDFARTHKDANNVKWVTDKNYSFVIFYEDDVRTRCAYTKNGRHLYTIRYMQEKHLDKDSRHLVKSHYYDYTINSVTEIENAQGKVLLVKISDDKEIKTLRISDDQFDIIEKFKKQ